MPPREIVAYFLIALLVLATAWFVLKTIRDRKRQRDILRGKIRPGLSGKRRRKALTCLPERS